MEKYLEMESEVKIDLESVFKRIIKELEKPKEDDKDVKPSTSNN